MARVLVVHNEADIRALLAYRFDCLGHEVFLEAGGDAGLTAALDLRPQVILLACQMPHRTGIEVCSELRSHHDFRNTGIFLLSACFQDSDRQLGIAAGADDCLVTSFTLKAVVTRVESYLASGVPCERFVDAAPVDPDCQPVRLPLGHLTSSG